MNWLGIIAGAAAVGAVGEVAIAKYFYNRTMIRSNAKREKTQKMAAAI